MPSPSSQNFRSAPQKQPMPNTAVRVPSGNGPASGVPSTWWVAGICMASARPGRASAASIILDFSRPNMPTRLRPGSGEADVGADEQLGELGILGRLALEHAPLAQVGEEPVDHDVEREVV